MGLEAVVHHLADDQKRGVCQLIEVGADRPFACCAHHGVVLGQASFGHDSHGQVALAKVKQVLGDFAQPPAPRFEAAGADCLSPVAAWRRGPPVSTRNSPGSRRHVCCIRSAL